MKLHVINWGFYNRFRSNRNTIFIIYLRKYPRNLIVPLTMNMFSYFYQSIISSYINKIHLENVSLLLNEKSVRNNFYCILKVSLTSFVLDIENKLKYMKIKFCYCMEIASFERLLWHNCQHFLSILT